MRLFILLLTVLSVTHAFSSGICSVCYSEPCPAPNASLSVLYCAQVGTGACGACSPNCSQCQTLNATNNYVCGCAGTTAPTPAPTVTPAPTLFNHTQVPSPAPTSAPTVFSQCTFCGFASPPISLPCNGSSSLLMLCETPVPSTCVPCPLFCSFCYPLLAPTPSYVCACPPTEAPTPAPTRSAAPTAVPTAAPTEAPPTVPLDWQTPAATIFTIAVVCASLALFLTCLLCWVRPLLDRYNRNTVQVPIFPIYEQQQTTTATSFGAGDGYAVPMEEQRRRDLHKRIGKMF